MLRSKSSAELSPVLPGKRFGSVLDPARTSLHCIESSRLAPECFACAGGKLRCDGGEDRQHEGLPTLLPTGDGAAHFASQAAAAAIPFFR